MSDGKINPYEVSRKIYESNVDSLILSNLFTASRIPDNSMVEDIKKNKIAIYTAFTGDYDQLKEPEIIDDNCDYICFTDNEEVKSDIWEIRPMEECFLDDNRKAKQYKVFPNKYLSEYKYSFWLDGSFKITGSIREYIYKYINSKMLVVVHPERDCIFQEANSSIQFPRYPKYLINKQVNFYKKMGMPKGYGLPALGAIFRQHNDSEIVDLMNQWWDEIIRFTNQDQLSFAYLMWKNDFHPSVSREFYWINDYWKVGSNQFQHKKTVDDYITSDKIVKKFNGNIKETNDFTKEELLLLLNDIDSLQSESLDLNVVRNNLDDKINNVRDSTSWKITSNLRRDGS